jgi:hypothetical protein
MESALFKKARIPQEVETESIVSHVPDDAKKGCNFPSRPLRLCAHPLPPQDARRGLIGLARRRKGAKRMAREGDYFMESAPFKKARIPQEVEAESIVSLDLRDLKKWHNRSITAM